MQLSRFLPFLPLLLLLPATSSTVLMMPSTNQTHLNPSDLCPLVQIVEHELCGNHVANAKNFSDLCLLLQNYNASFCSKAHAPSPSHSDDILSIRILENEFNEAHDNESHKIQDIRKVCPILNFIEQELCTSRTNPADFQFYPKQLCPLLNFTYIELCGA